MNYELYHLTDCNNTAKIIKEGIKANKQGEIYLFTDMLVANTIARDQVFVNRYSVFEIDQNGICGDLLNDDAGELSQGYHRVIIQRVIKPKFLKLLCEIDTIRFEATEWDYIRGKIQGMTRNEIDQQYLQMKKENEIWTNMSKEERAKNIKKKIDSLDPVAITKRFQKLNIISEEDSVIFDDKSGKLKFIIKNNECSETK